MNRRLLMFRLSKRYLSILLGFFVVLNLTQLVGQAPNSSPTLLPPPAHTYTKQLTKEEINEYWEENSTLSHAEKQRWILTQLRERGEYSIPSPEYERAILILKGHFSIEGHTHRDYILLYDSETIPVLNKMLRDESCEIHWKKALDAMGIIVSVDSSALSVKQALDNAKYVESKYEEEQNANRMFSLQNAYNALAYSGTPEALDYLKSKAYSTGTSALSRISKSFAIDALSKYPGTSGIRYLEELLNTSEDEATKQMAEESLYFRKVHMKLAERRKNAWQIRNGEIPHPSFNN